MLGSLVSSLKRYFGYRVVVYGQHSIDWNDALAAKAAIWDQIGNISEVIVAKNANGTLLIPQNKISRTVVIPLMEEHIAICPRNYRTLIPSINALEILRNKSNFAEYVIRVGLDSLCPKNYLNFDQAVYPCILKRVDLNAAIGVEIVYSKEELAGLLEQQIWKDRPYLLQEFIPGVEYVTHCVCRDGAILWNCSYRYESSDNIIRRDALTAKPVSVSEKILYEMENFLMPLSYTGPCNFDYKISEDGHIIVMEINPRLGGSLMMPRNITDLKSALSCILRHAHNKN